MSPPVTILVDPSAEGLPEQRPVAGRLASIGGKRIGLLDNIKHNAEYLLEAVERELRGAHGCDVRTVRKRTYTRPAEPEVLAALADRDAVITAIGD